MSAPRTRLWVSPHHPTVPTHTTMPYHHAISPCHTVPSIYMGTPQPCTEAFLDRSHACILTPCRCINSTCVDDPLKWLLLVDWLCLYVPEQDLPKQFQPKTVEIIAERHDQGSLTACCLHRYTPNSHISPCIFHHRLRSGTHLCTVSLARAYKAQRLSQVSGLPVKPIIGKLQELNDNEEHVFRSLVNTLVDFDIETDMQSFDPSARTNDALTEEIETLQVC
jgi:hypothetical protein